MRTNVFMALWSTAIILTLNFFFFAGTKGALTPLEAFLLFPAIFGIYTLYDGVVAYFKNTVAEAVKKENSRVSLKK